MRKIVERRLKTYLEIEAGLNIIVELGELLMIHHYTLSQLEAAVQRDLVRLEYPQPEWVLSRPGILDVLIIGGGQGGLSIAFGLMLEKVRNILVVDENAPGQEGPWRTFAR